MQWRNDVPDGADDRARSTTATTRPRLSIAYGGEGLKRFGPFYKWFLAIPLLIQCCSSPCIVAFIAFIVGIFNVVIEGPSSRDDQARQGRTDATRKAMKLNAYLPAHGREAAG